MTYAAAIKSIENKTVRIFDGIAYRNETLPGAIVRMDDGRTFAAKRTDEPRVDSGFAGCEWRLGLNLCELAVNIRITGRTMQTKNGAEWVRCEITYVGDCEPDTTARAWVRVL